MTMTTVGDGDEVPVTLGGRIAAMVLMAAGVGPFGTFTALWSHPRRPAARRTANRRYA